MLFHINQPNGEPLEIEIDSKQTHQTGKVILDEVLGKLGILESDFFGLQYFGSKGELLWLNLRNKICDQLQDKMQNLQLRVKFFVMPHFIPLEKTQELFYLQVKEALSKDLISLSEPQCDQETLARLAAYIVQAEHGNQTTNSYQRTVYHEILKEIHPNYQASIQLIERIHNEHLSLFGKSAASCRYFMLKEASALPGYGVERHKVTNTQGHEIDFGVGPEGIILQDHKTKSERIIPYVQIKLATHCEKLVQIQLFDDFGNATDESFKLVSKKAAVALYRCITEMHSFYRCDTVCSDVQSQFSRDFKGSFVSLFNENSALGKRYLFDIQRTRQEAYDHVKRQLYVKGQSTSPIHCLDNINSLSCHSGRDDHHVGRGNVNSTKKLQSEIKKLKDSWLCGICKDNHVSVVLLPCGHLTCELCAKLIDQCYQCFVNVEQRQRFYQGPVGNKFLSHSAASSNTQQLKRKLEYYEDSWLCCICKDNRVSIVLIPCGHTTCDVCDKLIDQCAQCRVNIECCQRFYQGPSGSKLWTEKSVDNDS